MERARVNFSEILDMLEDGLAESEIAAFLVVQKGYCLDQASESLIAAKNMVPAQLSS
jgi:hypothetical protein